MASEVVENNLPEFDLEIPRHELFCLKCKLKLDTTGIYSGRFRGAFHTTCAEESLRMSTLLELVGEITPQLMYRKDYEVIEFETPVCANCGKTAKESGCSLTLINSTENENQVRCVHLEGCPKQEEKTNE